MEISNSDKLHKIYNIYYHKAPNQFRLKNTGNLVLILKKNYKTGLYKIKRLY